MSHIQASRPLVEIINRIAIELEEAAISVDDLHALVETSVTVGATNEAFLTQAQTIDILQQHLVALSVFLTQISESMPSAWLIESDQAANNVKLSRLKERLSQICANPEMTADPPTGELQMF
jgi:hypothetical protein